MEMEPYCRRKRIAISCRYDNIYSKNTPHRTCPTPEERGKKQKWEYLFVDVEEILKEVL